MLVVIKDLILSLVFHGMDVHVPIIDGLALALVVVVVVPVAVVVVASRHCLSVVVCQLFFAII